MTVAAKKEKKADTFAAAAAAEHKTLLRKYLRRRLRTPEDLDDLAQEVYLRLLRIQDETQVMRITKPIAYVYGVAANVIADWYRSGHCNEPTVSLETAGHEQIDESPHALPEDPAELIARQQHLEMVFAELPPIQVSVLVLLGRDGLSYKEIAARLSLSVGMVHYHLKKARTRIRLTRRRDGMDISHD